MNNGHRSHKQRMDFIEDAVALAKKMVFPLDRKAAYCMVQLVLYMEADILERENGIKELRRILDYKEFDCLEVNFKRIVKEEMILRTTSVLMTDEPSNAEQSSRNKPPSAIAR